MQDPEPPWEELEKLALNCPTPSAGDVTVPNVSYETSSEACLCLLCQNDALEAENNHILQQLEQRSDTQQIQVPASHPTGGQNLIDRPYGTVRLLQSAAKARQERLSTTRKPIQDLETPELRRVPVSHDPWQRPEGLRGER